MIFAKPDGIDASSLKPAILGALNIKHIPRGCRPGVCFAALFFTLLLTSPALADTTDVVDSLQKTAGSVGDTAKDAAAKFTKLFQSNPWVWGHIVAAGLVITGLLLADIIRPGSLERSGKRTLEPHSAALWFSCAILVAGAQVIGGEFSKFLPAEYRGAIDTPQSTAMFAGFQYLSAIIVAIILARLISGSSKNCGLAFTARSLVWGTGAGLLAWPIVIASGFAFAMIHMGVTKEKIETLGHPTLQMLLNNKDNPWAWSLASMAIIAAPVVEEVIYRGFIQSAILKATSRPWTSIILSSIIFAAAHMLPAIFAAIQGGGDISKAIPWYSAATVGVLGLCMGVAFERTKEIGVPITMHVIFNATNVALAVFVMNKQAA